MSSSGRSGRPTVAGAREVDKWHYLCLGGVSVRLCSLNSVQNGVQDKRNCKAIRSGTVKDEGKAPQPIERMKERARLLPEN